MCYGHNTSSVINAVNTGTKQKDPHIQFIRLRSKHQILDLHKDVIKAFIVETVGFKFMD